MVEIRGQSVVLVRVEAVPTSCRYFYPQLVQRTIFVGLRFSFRSGRPTHTPEDYGFFVEMMEGKG